MNAENKVSIEYLSKNYKDRRRESKHSNDQAELQADRDIFLLEAESVGSSRIESGEARTRAPTQSPTQSALGFRP